MSLSLEPESRFRRLSRWGVESGGLRAAAILLAQLGFLVIASASAWQPGVAFDPAALGVVFVALEVGLLRGLGLALAIGYLADLFSGQPPGLWMFGAVCSYTGLRLLVFRVVGAQAVTVALLAGLAALMAAVARIGLEVFLGSGPSGIFPLRLMVLVLGSALLGYPAYLIFGWVSDRFRRRDDHTIR